MVETLAPQGNPSYDRDCAFGAVSLRTFELLLLLLLAKGSGVGGKVYRNLSVKASEGIAKRNVR